MNQLYRGITKPLAVFRSQGVKLEIYLTNLMREAAKLSLKGH